MIKKKTFYINSLFLKFQIAEQNLNFNHNSQNN